MIPLVFSTEIAFCLALFLYLLVAFIGSICFAMSVSYKLKLIYVLPEAIISAFSVTLFCYFSDAIRIRYLGSDIEKFTGSICFMPIWKVFLIALLLLIFVVIWLDLIVKKRLSSLTAMSVKEAITALSSGLCFFDETGRVLLINEQIDKECKEITGESLYDGLSFWFKMCNNKATKGVKIIQSDGVIIVERLDGKAICYKRIIHNFDGKKIYELSSTDISRELALKKEMEEKNENLKKMNLRLRKYGEIITEVTRERETLAARVKVHSNLGSLILRTKKSLSQAESNKNELIMEWNDIMSLIFTSDDEEDKFFEADKTASNVGVRIFYDGKRPPKNTSIEKLFANAVFECVVNTARHANGTELYVKMKENEKTYSIVLTNNGKQPTSEIKEGGGLSSLRTMTESVGGKMAILSMPKFTLSIIVSKEETNG